MRRHDLITQFLPGLSLLGLLALNVGHWPFGFVQNMGSYSLSSLSTSCSFAAQLRQMNDERTHTSCREIEGKSVHVNTESTTRTNARTSVDVSIYRITEDRSTSEGSPQTDSAGNPLPSSSTNNNNSQSITYRVVVTTHPPDGCTDCTGSESTEFVLDGSQYAGASGFNSMAQEVERRIRSHNDSHARTIARKANEEREERRKAERRRQVEERRQRRADACLIRANTAWDEREERLAGIEKIECNMDRLMDADGRANQRRIYHDDIKGELFEVLANGSEEEKREAREALGQLRSGIGRQDPTVRFSLNTAERALQYNASLEHLQAMLMEGTPHQRAGAEFALSNLRQNIEYEFKVYPDYFLANNALSSELRSDFAFWQDILSSDRQLYDPMRILTDSRAPLANMTLDLNNRLGRSLPGVTNIYQNPGSFDMITRNILPPGNLFNTPTDNVLLNQHLRPYDDLIHPSHRPSSAVQSIPVSGTTRSGGRGIPAAGSRVVN